MSKVDILMATYCGAHFLKEQIESILNQSHQDFNLYISDDGSSDDTLSIIRSFHDSRIHIVEKNPHPGVIGNFSHLMSFSTAPYILFSDQDDVWFKDKIEKTLQLMKEVENSEIPVLVHTDLQVVDGALNLIHPSFFAYTKLKPLSHTTFPKLLTQNVVTGCTTMINRALLTLAHPVPDQVAMHDWWLALIATAFGKIAVLNEPTMLYRQHAQNSLGAKKYNLKSYLKRWLKKEFAKDKRSQQAEVFRERFNDYLTQEQRATLRGFKDYVKGSFFKKRVAMFKFSFYKTGFYRQLHDWLS